MWRLSRKCPEHVLHCRAEPGKLQARQGHVTMELPAKRHARFLRIEGPSRSSEKLGIRSEVVQRLYMAEKRAMCEC